MIRKFLLVVLLGPVVELAVAVMVASRIGIMWTVVAVVATSLLGALLIRSEGIAALRGFRRDMTRGVPPGLGLMNGVLRVFGAVLMLVPGLVTSLIGLLLLIPPIRALVAPLAVARLAARAAASVRVVGLDGFLVDVSSDPTTGSTTRRPGDGGGDVIDAEGWDVDDRAVHQLGRPDDDDPGRQGTRR